MTNSRASAAQNRLRNLMRYERLIAKPLFISSGVEIGFIGRAGVLASPHEIEDSRVITPAVYTKGLLGRILFYDNGGFVLGMDDTEVKAHVKEEIDPYTGARKPKPIMDRLALELTESQKCGPEYTGDVLAFMHIDHALHRLSSTLEKIRDRDGMLSCRVRIAENGASIIDTVLKSGTVISVYSGMNHPGLPMITIRITDTEDRLYYVPALFKDIAKDNGMDLLREMADNIIQNLNEFMSHVESPHKAAHPVPDRQIMHVSVPIKITVRTESPPNVGLAELQPVV